LSFSSRDEKSCHNLKKNEAARAEVKKSSKKKITVPSVKERGGRRGMWERLARVKKRGKGEAYTNHGHTKKTPHAREIVWKKGRESTKKMRRQGLGKKKLKLASGSHKKRR